MMRVPGRGIYGRWRELDSKGKKMNLLKSVAVFLLLVVCAGCACTMGKNAPAKTAMADEGGAMLRHVVLFKFKDSATPEDIVAVETAFVGLADKIDIIKDLEWGTNVSPEKHDQGYTHCFFLTFASEADRDAYLVHPAHKEFGTLVGPVLDGVHVLDYWAK